MPSDTLTDSDVAPSITDVDFAKLFGDVEALRSLVTGGLKLIALRVATDLAKTVTEKLKTRPNHAQSFMLRTLARENGWPDAVSEQLFLYYLLGYSRQVKAMVEYDSSLPLNKKVLITSFRANSQLHISFELVNN